MQVIDRLAEADPKLIRKTRRLVVKTGEIESCRAGERWWQELTDAGCEGMVVKPLNNLPHRLSTPGGSKTLVQPGIKVRGREYLRIIYDPDYTDTKNPTRLKNRNFAHKRSLALREYSLGIESVDRLVVNEPLWKIHQAVFAVLALESKTIDPRL